MTTATYKGEQGKERRPDPPKGTLISKRFSPEVQAKVEGLLGAVVLGAAVTREKNEGLTAKGTKGKNEGLTLEVKNEGLTPEGTPKELRTEGRTKV